MLNKDSFDEQDLIIISIYKFQNIVQINKKPFMLIKLLFLSSFTQTIVYSWSYSQVLCQENIKLTLPCSLKSLLTFTKANSTVCYRLKSYWIFSTCRIIQSLWLVLIKKYWLLYNLTEGKIADFKDVKSINNIAKDLWHLNSGSNQINRITNLGIFLCILIDHKLAFNAFIKNHLNR